MSKKDAESPATTSAAYDMMQPSWQKVQTVLDGTRALRAAGKTFLPRHAEETTAAYTERLDRNTLFNMTKVTLQSWVGRPFSDPIKKENLATPIEAIMDDVDLLGSSVHTFGQAVFSDGLAKAYTHVYVDFPRVRPSADGAVRTLADDKADNLRPYWIHIRPEQLFFADAEIIDGREVLKEIRYWEQVKERVGFAEVTIDQIRRVTLVLAEPEGGGEPVKQGFVQTYRPAKKGSNQHKKKWVLYESYLFDFDEIPLVTFYADRDDFMLGVPPLEDLADLNIAHWQSTSDQRAVLTVARFPMLALSGGVDEDSKLTVGPNKWLWSPDAQAKFYYVEHEGKAIEAGRKDLLALEAQMAEYGAEFLKKKPGGMTATARALDSAEATSQLQDVTLRFMHALNRIIELTAKWLRVENAGTLALSTDFGPEELNASDLQTLVNARKMRDVSRKAFIEELQRRGLLSDEFDEEKDAAQLEQEALDFFGAPADVDEEGDEDTKKTDEEEEE